MTFQGQKQIREVIEAAPEPFALMDELDRFYDETPCEKRVCVSKDRVQWEGRRSTGLLPTEDIRRVYPEWRPTGAWDQPVGRGKMKWWREKVKGGHLVAVVTIETKSKAYYIPVWPMRAADRLMDRICEAAPRAQRRNVFGEVVHTNEQ